MMISQSARGCTPRLRRRACAGGVGEWPVCGGLFTTAGGKVSPYPRGPFYACPCSPSGKTPRAPWRFFGQLPRRVSKGPTFAWALFL